MRENSHLEEILSDPTLSAFDLPLRRRVFPFGFPLDFETNSPDAMEAMSEEWGEFKQASAYAPVRVCLGVSDSDAGALSEGIVRSRGHLLTVIFDPENFMVYDFNQGLAFGWVTNGVAADRHWLRRHFLAAAGRWIVEQRYLAALHGALIARNERGILLCGDSFAGKSTLAYACARAGWTFLSDDGTFLIRSRCDRFAIGDPYVIRLRLDAPDLFPELADTTPKVRRNGRIGIEIRTHEWPIAVAHGCAIENVVLLNRNKSGPAHLRPCNRQRMQESWRGDTPFGTDQVREEQQRCFERLLDADLWEMRYSNLDDAISTLEQLAGGR
jgi:hypothetical protein